MSAETGGQKKVFGLPYNVGVGLLCVLGVICLYEFYSNVLAGPSIPDTPRSNSSAAVAQAPSIPLPDAPGPDVGRKQSQQKRNEEFNPPLHSKRAEDRIDPTRVDPTLRLDLFAKVQSVEPAGGARNLFQMGVAPPKPVQLAGIEPVVKPIGPVPPAPKIDSPKPPPPPILPIPLKFYGFSTIRATGKKTAYFMDGEDVLLANEGDTLKHRYHLLKIQQTSVLMEDTEAKRTEVIQLTPEAQS